MTVYPKVRNSVVNLVEHINEKTQSNIVEASRSSMLNLNERDLSTIVEIIGSSIKQGLTTGFSEIEAVIRDIDRSIEASTKKPKSKK